MKRKTSVNLPLSAQSFFTRLRIPSGSTTNMPMSRDEIRKQSLETSMQTGDSNIFNLQFKMSLMDQN
jgi:hypothetical protein